MTPARDGAPRHGLAVLVAAALVALTVAVVARWALPGTANDALVGGPAVGPADDDPGPSGPTLDPAAPATGRRDLLEACDVRPSVPAPDAAAPAEVYLCGTEPVRVPDDGTWTERVVRRATGPVAPLLATLRPPATRPAGDSCAAVSYARSVVLLVAPDGTVSTISPFLGTPCGGDATDVLAAAAFTDEVGRARLARVSGEQESLLADQVMQAERRAAEVGCAGTWKDMASVELLAPGPSHPPLTTTDLWADRARVTACVFRLSPALSASDLPVGQFVTGRLLTLAEGLQVRAALLTPARPATDTGCAARATRFVVLSAEPGSFVVAHLDGCRLVDVDGHGVRVSTTALTGLLERLSAPVP